MECGGWVRGNAGWGGWGERLWYVGWDWGVGGVEVDVGVVMGGGGGRGCRFGLERGAWRGGGGGGVAGAGGGVGGGVVLVGGFRLRFFRGLWLLG